MVQHHFQLIQVLSLSRTVDYEVVKVGWRRVPNPFITQSINCWKVAGDQRASPKIETTPVVL